MQGTDPFTRTPGIAGKAYIDNGIADEIIKDFCSGESSKFVYKITGLRGSGKSVEYGRIIQTLKKEKNWLVYPLSSAGDAVSTLISKLSMEKFIDSNTTAMSETGATAFGGNILAVTANETVTIQKTVTENDYFYSDEATIAKMISQANEKNYKVLVGIDDISKTPDMVKLLSMIGSMLLEGLPIYLVVTGSSENIEDFSTENNLTFFKRADEREITTLNKFDITYMYEKLLGVDTVEARRIEALTNGYAYAYQVLGSLYFKKKSDETLEDLIPAFERIMFKDSYELIWKTLTKGEKEVVRCIYKSKDGSAAGIKELMEKPTTYSVYRDRLINKHLVDGDTRGYLKIRLPLFEKYIEIWGED